MEHLQVVQVQAVEVQRLFLAPWPLQEWLEVALRML
jgi:hypothetical protein